MNLQRVRTAIRHIDRLPEVITCLAAVQQGPAIAASYVGLKPLRLPHTVRLRNGTSYRLEEYTDLETLWQIYFHHVYPLQAHDEVIVDAGANVGLFACWAAARNPQARIYAVEPSPDNTGRLLEHLRMNGVDDRVQLFTYALSSTERTVWLADNPNGSQMRHVTSGPTGGGVTVPALSLGELLARVPHDRVDFLKMDIEGSEYDVLMGTTAEQLSPVRRISFEYHQPPRGCRHDKASLLAHLASCGYSAIVDAGGRAEYGMIHAARPALGPLRTASSRNH